MADLFQAAAKRSRSEDPLADRMRPQTLEEVVGQEHILGEGKLLRRLIKADRIPSLVFWGPPGTGKTTMARLLAKQTKAYFASLSAVLSGVKELRQVLEAAKQRRGLHGERTLLFIDEIHRWSKSQQDALLDAVERGLVTLIGATTENPSFELNAALLSRARVFVLEALSEDQLVELLQRALELPERGLAELGIKAEPEALRTIAKGAHGDARQALGVLEVAAKDTLLLKEQGAEPILTQATATEAMQHRALLYDKAGDAHYGVVSAFIKSLRGSDPDAAVYYLARMLESGEDPRFVLRRMVIFAAEDIGNADPQALTLATSALSAYEFIGMPEGVLPLSQTALYLAMAPKSNTALKAYGAARKDIKQMGPLPVPSKLLNASNRMAKQMGHGKNYRYPHDLGGVAPGETYLPEQIEGRRYYFPSENGAEKQAHERLEELLALRKGDKGQD